MDATHWIQYSPSTGIIHAVLSTILLALAHCSAQLTIQTTKNFPQLEMVLVRSLVQTVLLSPFVLLLNLPVFFGRDKWMHICLVTLTDYACYIILYYALQMVQLSYVISLSALCPFFASLFSYLILNERYKWVDGICGTGSIIGVICVVKPTYLFGDYGEADNLFHQNNSSTDYGTTFRVGAALSVVYGMGRALYLTLVQKWARESSETKSNQIIAVLYPSVVGCAITPALMLLSGEQLTIPVPAYGIFSLFAVGILTTFGLTSLTLALKTQNATVVSGIKNLEIIWAFLLQYFLMGMTPTLWSIGGAILLVLSGIAISFRDNVE